MKGDTNMTTVEALKNLYTALGGDEADVADLKLNPEVVEALAGLDIGGGGGTLRTVYADTSGAHGGDGQPSTPFGLFLDEELTEGMTKEEIIELMGSRFIIEDINTSQGYNIQMCPVAMLVSAEGAEEDAAEIATFTLGEGLAAIYLGYYNGGAMV